MGDFEDSWNRMTDSEVFKTMLKQQKTLPCPYGGGDCLITSPGVNKNEMDGIYQLVGCFKAKNAQDGHFGAGRREKELRKMGCPNPDYGFFSGWKCKYADGSWYPL